MQDAISGLKWKRTLSQMLVLKAFAVCHEKPHPVGARVRANLKRVLEYGDDEPLPNAF